MTLVFSSLLITHHLICGFLSCKNNLSTCSVIVKQHLKQKKNWLDAKIQYIPRVQSPSCLPADCLQRQQWRAVSKFCQSHLSFIDMQKRISFLLQQHLQLADSLWNPPPHTHKKTHSERTTETEVGGESWLPVSLCVLSWFPLLSC